MTTNAQLEASTAAFAQTIENEVSNADIAKAKSSMATHLGIVRMKISGLASIREDLQKAIDGANPNKEAVAYFSQEIADGRRELLVAKTKYQMSVIRYLSAGEKTEEANTPYFKAVPAAQTELLAKVTTEEKASSNAICAGLQPAENNQPANNPSTEKLKVEKELKPDHRLDENDTLDTYTIWFAKFKTYFELSNFKLASP